MIFGRKKCDMCKAKIKKDEEPPMLRVGTADGVIEMRLCRDCANFMDLVADRQQRKLQDDDTNSL